LSEEVKAAKERKEAKNDQQEPRPSEWQNSLVDETFLEEREYSPSSFSTWQSESDSKASLNTLRTSADILEESLKDMEGKS